jgi:hypothetical protein
MFQRVALSISANDTTDLPERDVVQELMPADTYFANEQLVDVVGG